ncbi:MAG: flagellar export protein FliJ [Thermogutta sp.]|nr:flagellar export protein FliJ [Thermogutta sp.]HOP76896.1 flagellar export protein FliJ [Thermogutta sp.]HPU05456.1 flagellar export protein FliJ [Thermogutta sp.]HPZ82419.1 flagellar export protein FliJ [Thermogutta sp.]HQF12278.1 flagellar export protein FliJ [Thermogutta sp.]
MRRFTFRLETVLRIREQERDERKRELEQAYAARDILLRQRDALEAERQHLGAALRESLQQGSIDADQMLAWRRYEAVLNAQREYLTKQLSAIEGEIEKRQLALMEANREVRILEVLRDKQRTAHEKQERAREGKKLDEIANRRSHGLREP